MKTTDRQEMINHLVTEYAMAQHIAEKLVDATRDLAEGVRTAVAGITINDPGQAATDFVSVQYSNGWWKV